MYKNQLQELAQRSCFNLPSYACIREGPDHAPRFKACVNFNGEIFESPSYCNTLRQAEHAAAEVALNVLSTRGPSRSLTARVLDETGIYKNLLQETAHRAGLNLPVYTTVRSGPGHVPTFTCTVGIAGMSFTGESAKTKKQAEKNAAIAAWSALKTGKTLVPDLSSLRPRDEAKQGIRRRDQNQPRRGLIRANAVNHSASPSTSLQLHRLLEELLMNYIPQAQGGPSSFSSSSSSSQKQSCFLSLLPPPPPRSASKILPPPRDNRWDKEQDCGKRPIGSSIYPSPNIVNKRNDHPKLARPNSSLSFLEGTSRDGHHAHTRNGSGLCPRSVYTGGFRPHRIAPAVQIRSVIPVCAAPPAPLMRTQLPILADDPLCPQTGLEIPPTSSNPKLDKLVLEPDSAQLGSELNKK
ncbi:double-stranded RNA-binding protein 5-like isoform X1 [Syzygium oleosum]|uniref:double-stranded RNA-binding protein 5-like isoform X1 n=1 Tax=Syzygium oleosum TaxID=219896 RepID=UPI0024B98024|nr:double-stranded RNA-binding protein 5-like isoform X1 [Syzygium oleosum]